VPLTDGQNRVFEVARVKAYVKVLLEARTNRYDVESHDAARAGNSDIAAQLSMRSNYWKSVSAWVEKLK
jgi:hypothetical protein